MNVRYIYIMGTPHSCVKGNRAALPCKRSPDGITGGGRTRLSILRAALRHAINLDVDELRHTFPDTVRMQHMHDA